MSFIRVAFATLIASVLLYTSARADLYDVQFGATAPTASTQYSGSAVVGGGGDQWNYFQSNNGSAALNTSTGLASGLSINFTALGTYGLPSGGAFNGTQYQNLMNSFLYTWAAPRTNPPIQLTISGLSASQGFSVYLYGQSESASYGEAFTANGASAFAYDTVASTLISGNNYVELSGIATAAGTVVITATAAPGRIEADLNGLQLVTTPIPEPATLGLLAAGIIGAAALRSRRRSR